MPIFEVKSRLQDSVKNILLERTENYLIKKGSHSTWKRLGQQRDISVVPQKRQDRALTQNFQKVDSGISEVRLWEPGGTMAKRNRGFQGRKSWTTLSVGSSYRILGQICVSEPAPAPNQEIILVQEIGFCI